MRVVLFDLDDTLFDHKHCSRAGLVAVQETFAGRIDVTVDELETTYRDLLEQWHSKVLDGSMTIEESRVKRFQALLSDDQTTTSDHEAQIAAQAYRDAYNLAYQAVPGAIDLLRQIQAEHPIGIVTNHVVAEQVKKIAAIGVEPFIDELVVSEEVGVAKPDSKIFQEALSRLGGKADEAVMMGDSWSSDIIGAARMGIRAIWLNRYDQSCPDASLATEVHSLTPTNEVANLILEKA